MRPLFHDLPDIVMGCSIGNVPLLLGIKEHGKAKVPAGKHESWKSRPHHGVKVTLDNPPESSNSLLGTQTTVIADERHRGKALFEESAKNIHLLEIGEKEKGLFPFSPGLYQDIPKEGFPFLEVRDFPEKALSGGTRGVSDFQKFSFQTENALLEEPFEVLSRDTKSLKEKEEIHPPEWQHAKPLAAFLDVLSRENPKSQVLLCGFPKGRKERRQHFPQGREIQEREPLGKPKKRRGKGGEGKHIANFLETREFLASLLHHPSGQNPTMEVHFNGTPRKDPVLEIGRNSVGKSSEKG